MYIKELESHLYLSLKLVINTHAHACTPPPPQCHCSATLPPSLKCRCCSGVQTPKQTEAAAVQGVSDSLLCEVYK